MVNGHAYAAFRMIPQVAVMVHAADNSGKNDDQRQAERKPLLHSLVFALGLGRNMKKRKHYFQ
jgi:hypothetical protein